MATHELKSWPEYFDAVFDGKKTFEVRKGNDRDYKVGDTLEIRRFDPVTWQHTNGKIVCRITYVMHGGPFLPEDVWVLGLDRPRMLGIEEGKTNIPS